MRTGIERVKEMIFELGTLKERTSTYTDYQIVEAAFQALVKTWGEVTNGAVLSRDVPAVRVSAN